MINFVTKQVIVEGKNVNVLITGGTKEKALIYIHGAGCNGRIFTNLIEKLPEYTHVIIDLPGRGNSLIIDIKSSVHEYAEFVYTVCKQLKSEYNHLVLVGHSLGATIAMNLMVSIEESSNLIDKFVAIAGAIDTSFITDEVVNAMGNPEIFNALVTKELESFSKKDKELFTIEVSNYLENDEVRKRDFACAKGYSIISDIPNRNFNLLCISGNQDGIVNVEEQNKIKSKINGADLSIIPESGHFVLCEHEKGSMLGKIIKNYIEE